MNIKKRMIAVLAAGAIVLAGCGSNQKTLYNNPDSGEVYIGVVYPAAEMDSQTNYISGINLAVETVNRNGGVLGKELRLLTKDDTNDPTIALQKAQAFSDEGIQAVIGHWGTNVSYLTEDVYEQNHVVMMTASSTGMALFDEKHNYVFRVIANNQVFSKAVAKDMAARGIHYAAISYSDDTYGHSFSNILENELTDQGIVVVDKISNLSAANAGQVHDRLRAFGCEAVVLAKTPPTVWDDIRLIRSFAPEYQLFSAENLARSSFLNGKQSEGDGIHVAIYDDQSLKDTFVQAFGSAYGETPDIYAIAGYEAVMLLADAMNETKSIEGEAISAYLQELSDYHSIGGVLNYDAKSQEFVGHEAAMVTIGEREVAK